jgi:hypothetical protein
MTWGGYKAETSKVAELDLTKPPSDEPIEDPAEKAAAEAEHWANVEADEQDRQRLLASPPDFKVVAYPAGDFLCLPDDGDTKGEMVPRSHIESIGYVPVDAFVQSRGSAPYIAEWVEDNWTFLTYYDQQPPRVRKRRHKAQTATPAYIEIRMISGRTITVKICRHYPEITFAELTKAWREKKAEPPK